MTMLTALYILQSFIVAMLAIVIATFSTGIDSQCFQVCASISRNIFVTRTFSKMTFKVTAVHED